MRFVGEGISKLSEDIVGPCSTPFVNGLVIVTHYYYICTLACKQFNEALLPVVHVLVLVHNNKISAVAPLLINLVLCFKNSYRHRNKVIVGKCILLKPKAFEFFINE